MPSAAAAHAPAARGRRLVAALSVAGALIAAAHAAEMPPEALLLQRLCADTLRANEEDRLYGLISLEVRTTINYAGGAFSPDLIDDAVQDALGAMIAACPEIAATRESERLGMAVAMIRDATIKRMQDKTANYSAEQTQRASAADLSEELSAQEIDAWLNALPPQQRALALLRYATHPTAAEISDAVGLPAAGIAAASLGVKEDLLAFFRAEWNVPQPPPIPDAPAIAFHEAGETLAALLAPATPQAARTRITGISPDIYAGWSLLARVTGLPAEYRLELPAPIILQPNEPGHRRMLAVALDEIGDPHDPVRRFLVKAFAIDGEAEGSGLRDGFHFGAALDNAAAQQTLGNPRLAAIETARCLWHDFGTAPDPGLCR